MAADLPLPAIRSQIASAIDILVHLGRLRDKSRRVLEIVEVGDYRDGEIHLNPLFCFVEEEDEDANGKKGQKNGKVCGHLEKVGELQAVGKLKNAGYPI